LPDLEALADPVALARVPAVALLLDRAEAAGSDLRLNAENARAVAELCLCMGGLPLALELAATQMRFISPDAQLARMEHRLDLPAHGAWDRPRRQQTFQEALGWSYRLLSETDRSVFRRVGCAAQGRSTGWIDCSANGRI